MKYSLNAVWMFLFCGSCLAAFFGPSNFNECITDSMKGTTSDVAARAIYQACRERFPDNTASQQPFKFKDEALRNLTGKANYLNPYGRPQLRVTLYNGDRTHYISRVTIEIISKDRKAAAPMRYSSGAVFIRPLTTEDFSIDILNPIEGGFDWRIVDAIGGIE